MNTSTVTVSNHLCQAAGTRRVAAAHSTVQVAKFGPPTRSSQDPYGTGRSEDPSTRGSDELFVRHLIVE